MSIAITDLPSCGDGKLMGEKDFKCCAISSVVTGKSIILEIDIIAFLNRIHMGAQPQTTVSFKILCWGIHESNF